MAKEQKHRKTFRDWDCLIERGNRREMKTHTEETSLILLVEEQGDSQRQQQTDLMKENTSLLRQISCITCLQNSFTKAG